MTGFPVFLSRDSIEGAFAKQQSMNAESTLAAFVAKRNKAVEGSTTSETNLESIRILKGRNLENLSYLIFEYPINIAKGKTTTPEPRQRIKIPLFENVDISESQKPNVSPYELIGRSGNLFSYLGSKSREFTLTFNITLPNIVQYMTSEKAPKYSIDPNLSLRKLHSIPAPNVVLNRGFAGVFAGGFAEGSEFQGQRLISYWINIIRTSVINNSQNTTLGPPTIYINHGDMYQNIPCVCTNFSLKNIPTGGYDTTTLIPRIVGITLNLSENRTGNLGTFVPFKPLLRNNLPGWESVFDYGTLDPGEE